MFASLVYNLCQGSHTELRVYRTRKAFEADPDSDLLRIRLDASQLTELVVVQGIKAVDLNR